jgi:hypothetical protein
MLSVTCSVPIMLKTAWKSGCHFPSATGAALNDWKITWMWCFCLFYIANWMSSQCWWEDGSFRWRKSSLQSFRLQWEKRVLKCATQHSAIFKSFPVWSSTTACWIPACRLWSLASASWSWAMRVPLSFWSIKRWTSLLQKMFSFYYYSNYRHCWPISHSLVMKDVFLFAQSRSSRFHNLRSSCVWTLPDFPRRWLRNIGCALGHALYSHQI